MWPGLNNDVFQETFGAKYIPGNKTRTSFFVKDREVNLFLATKTFEFPINRGGKKTGSRAEKLVLLYTLPFRTKEFYHFLVLRWDHPNFNGMVLRPENHALIFLPAAVGRQVME